MSKEDCMIEFYKKVMRKLRLGTAEVLQLASMSYDKYDNVKISKEAFIERLEKELVK